MQVDFPISLSVLEDSNNAVETRSASPTRVRIRANLSDVADQLLTERRRDTESYNPSPAPSGAPSCFGRGNETGIIFCEGEAGQTTAPLVNSSSLCKAPSENSDVARFSAEAQDHNIQTSVEDIREIRNTADFFRLPNFAPSVGTGGGHISTHGKASSSLPVSTIGSSFDSKQEGRNFLSENHPAERFCQEARNGEEVHGGDWQAHRRFPLSPLNALALPSCGDQSGGIVNSKEDKENCLLSTPLPRANQVVVTGQPSAFDRKRGTLTISSETTKELTGSTTASSSSLPADCSASCSACGFAVLSATPEKPTVAVAENAGDTDSSFLSFSPLKELTNHRQPAVDAQDAWKKPETATAFRQVCPTYALHAELVEKATDFRTLALYLLVCFGPLLQLLQCYVEQKVSAASPSFQNKTETRATHRQNEDDCFLTFDVHGECTGSRSTSEDYFADSERHEETEQVPTQLTGVLSDKLKGIGAILQVLIESTSTACSQALDAVCDALAVTEHTELQRLPHTLLSFVQKAPDSLSSCVARGSARVSSMEAGEEAAQCGGSQGKRNEEETRRPGMEEGQESMNCEKASTNCDGDKHEEGKTREKTAGEGSEGDGRTEALQGSFHNSESAELISVPLWSGTAQEVLEQEHGHERRPISEEQQKLEEESENKETGNCESPSYAPRIEETLPTHDDECTHSWTDAAEQGEEKGNENRPGEGEKTPCETLPENLQWMAHQLATPLDNLRGEEEEEQLLRAQLSFPSFFRLPPASDASAPAAVPHSGEAEVLGHRRSEERNEQNRGDKGQGQTPEFIPAGGSCGKGRRLQGADEHELDIGARREDTTETERVRRRSETLAAELIHILENANYQKHLRAREKHQHSQLLVLLRKLQEQQTQDAGDRFVCSSTRGKNGVAEGHSGFFSTVPSCVYESPTLTGIPTRDTQSPLSSLYASRLASKRVSVSSSSGGMPVGSCTTTASAQASSGGPRTLANAYSPLSSTPPSPASSLLSPPQNLSSQQLVGSSADNLPSSPLLLPSSSLSIKQSAVPHRLANALSHIASSAASGDSLLATKAEDAGPVRNAEREPSTVAFPSRAAPNGKPLGVFSGESTADQLSAVLTFASASAPRLTSVSAPEVGFETKRTGDEALPSLSFSGVHAVKGQQEVSSVEREDERFSSDSAPKGILRTAVQLFLRRQKSELAERVSAGDSAREWREGRGKAFRDEGLSQSHFASLSLPYSPPHCPFSTGQGSRVTSSTLSEPCSSHIPSLLGSCATHVASTETEEVTGTAGEQEGTGRDLHPDVFSFPSFSAFLSRVVAQAQEEDTQARREDHRRPREDGTERGHVGGDSERRPEDRKASRRAGGSNIEGLEADTKRVSNADQDDADEGRFFRNLALHLVRLSKREQEERHRGRASHLSETYSSADVGSTNPHTFSSSNACASTDRRSNPLSNSPSDTDRPGEATPSSCIGSTKLGSLGHRNRNDWHSDSGLQSVLSSLSTSGPGHALETPTSFFGSGGTPLTSSAFELSSRPPFGEEGDRNAASLPFSGGELPSHLLLYSSPEFRGQSTRRLAPSVPLSPFTDPTSQGATGGDSSRSGECTSALSPPLKDGGASRSVAGAVEGLLPFVGPPAGVSPFVGCRGLGGGDCRCGGPETGCLYRSGVSGVVYDKSGQKWTARWNEDGKQHKRTFAAAKYGFLNAKMRAEACRGEARERAAARARQATERSQQRRTDTSKGTRGIGGERDKSRFSCVAAPSCFQTGASLSVRSARACDEGERGREEPGAYVGKHLGVDPGAFPPTSAKHDSEAEGEEGEGRRDQECARETGNTATIPGQKTVKRELRVVTLEQLAAPPSLMEPAGRQAEARESEGSEEAKRMARDASSEIGKETEEDDKGVLTAVGRDECLAKAKNDAQTEVGKLDESRKEKRTKEDDDEAEASSLRESENNEGTKSKRRRKDGDEEWSVTDAEDDEEET
ncbi:AP2 domain transcription factor AP2IV-5 [Toxoplasma gondii GAB2-2007-GAL-DOM2]|uniref:AP2 domain transcription factor AP2IV-5 n=2 Tax=Toxoplasma gondii TaxID=5811 RepID=A0A086K227_TOXGO|nr:AP2 domain transcription factor AP2IV-5 [Toxoplasma gondii GAB2-2007-GAL-DOM2]KFG38445.1 AP2 domain transcription factor AP2IV-5 [Toxoplasma gondii FOU]